jgi:diguanylate cyclase (GGDEF)-like protein
VAVLGLLWLALRRQPRDLEPRLDHIQTTVEGIKGRIDDALGGKRRARDQWRSIHETLDLEQVLQRILHAAGALGTVDGGRVTVVRPGGTPVTAVCGLVDPDANPLEGPPDGSQYTHGIVSWEAPARGTLRAGLVVPFAGGSLSVFSRLADAFDPEAARLLGAIAREAEPAVRNALEHQRVIDEAATDPLTRLGTARAFAITLAREIESARRHDRPLCLLQIDLDDFGTINKSHPRRHAAGDDALAGFGERVNATLRGSDSAFRNSGGADEFFVILPDTGLDDAKRMYARLKADMAAAPFGDVGPVTMSSGLARLRADDTTETLLARVNLLMGVAKDAGKDQLVSEDNV